MPVTHTFVNAHADGADSTITRPSNWNANHTVTGTLLDEGTTFPGSPVTDQKKYRTDLNMGFFYNGTRWLCTCLHSDMATLSDNLQPFTASGNYMRWAGFNGTTTFSNVWIEGVVVAFDVLGGTALSGSHKWVIDMIAEGSGTTLGNVANINSGASSVWRSGGYAIVNALLGTDLECYFPATKTGTPGDLRYYPRVFYRFVAT